MWSKLLLEAAAEARKRLLPLIKERRKLSSEFDLTQYRKLLDIEAETGIEEILRQNGFNGLIVSEEAQLQLGQPSVTRIIVDPLDGTNNVSRGVPLAGVSLCVSETDRFGGVRAGLVMNIYTGQAYSAERGQGAFVDGIAISPSKLTSLNEAVLSVDVSKASHVKPLERLFARVRHVRQLGSAALSLSFVAEGVLDAYVDVRGIIRITDVAAGLCIVREAGGLIHLVGESLDNVELTREKRLSLVASANPSLMKEILELLDLEAPI